MTNFLIPITVLQLPTIAELEGKQGMFILPDGSININRKNGTWMIINKQSDHGGILKPADNVVTQPGVAKWYWAGSGTYSNAGDEVIDQYGILSYNGAEWQSLEIDLPKATQFIPEFTGSTFPIAGPAQRIHENEIFEIALGVSASNSDVPGISNKWTKKVGGGSVASTFNPINSIDPQGAKQINDYFLGVNEVYTANLFDRYINDSWVVSPVNGYNSVIIETVNEGDKISVVKNSTNTDFSIGLKVLNQNAKVALLKFENEFSFIVPKGFDKASFTSNGDTNWTIKRSTLGALEKSPIYTISEKTTTWSDGSWGDSGEAAAAPGYRRIPILDTPSKVKLTGFTSTVYLKLYSDTLKKIFQIDAENNVEYDVTGFDQYSIVVFGNEGSGKVFEIKEGGSGNAQSWNVKDMGVKGDGLTDDTVAINNAVVKRIKKGGGDLYFPESVYLSDQVFIPNMENWETIELVGDFAPAQRFGTIVVPGTFGPDVTKPNGTVIKSTSQTAHAVIFGNQGTAYSNFNIGQLIVKNMTLRTYQNSKISGIDAWSLAQLHVENVFIDTGVYNVLAIEPTYDVTGIITPKDSNGALTYLKNIAISGYMHGIKVFEHTNGDSIQLQSCKHALSIYQGNHASFFNRVCAQRNTNQVSIFGTQKFEINQMNMEYAGVGQTTPENAWQSTQYELNDPNNLGIGEIKYANVKGNLGSVNTFRMNGGSGVIVKRIGNETRLPGTIPSP